MQLVGYLCLHLLDFLCEGLEYPCALLVGALNFAFGAFDPADGGSQIYSHEDMLLIIDEWDGVGDIFFIADLMILRILVESGLIFADYGLVVVVLAL